MNTKKSAPYDRTAPYNRLPLLPVTINFLDNELLMKWGLASRELAALNKNILRLPNPGMLFNTITLQEAKSSSEIENIFTTDDELYKAISDTVKESNANPNTKEVLRYREALWEGYEHIHKRGKIDQAAIVKIFRQVKDTREGIRPPQSHIVVKRGSSEFRSGEVVYTPPGGKGVVEEKLKNLVQYINDDKKDLTDPLLKMIIAHYQFEAIHPFSDGNGRTGRILNLLYLIKQGLISHPVLYLSKYIIDHKDDYYHYLAGVTQRNAWKGWMLYMLTAVEQTSRHTNQVIDQIIDQMGSTLEYARPWLKWYNKEMNEALFTQPYIKPKVIGDILGRTSRTTLTKYMAELVRLKVLTPKADGKEVYYINHDLVRILSD